MKTTIKFDRRSFMKVSAAAGGGVVIGFNILSSCTNPEQVASIPKEWFDVNAFLKIADNGMVTIMSPNPEVGQGVKTSMPMIVAEELDVDWKDVIVEQAPLDTDKFTRQVAGGSQSIRQSWEGLRMAGATARTVLVMAAAKTWEVDPSECTTEAGKVFHKASGKSVGYGEIASAAAGIEVPEQIELKDPKNFKIIGTAVPNVDIKEIVTGKPLFGIDYTREGMYIAMIEHAPAFGMKLKSVDDSAAKSMPGIQGVYSFDNLVAVVGSTTWEVKKAKEALKIEWESDGSQESSEDHSKLLNDLLAKKPVKPERKDGNPDAVFNNAAKVLEKSYEAPFLAHNALEPLCFFAHVTDEKVDLAGSIQTPERTRKQVAEKLQVEESKVSIGLTRIGGGFGRKLNGHYVVEAAMVSKLAGVPVKLVYTREDDMTQGNYRPAYKVMYRAAIDADGNLAGIHIRGAGLNGRSFFPDRFPAGTVDNYLAEMHDNPSDMTTYAWRAPVSNFIAYAEQAFIDELAAELGKDPIDFRLELFERAIQKPVGEKNDYDASRYMGVLKLVREKSGWDKPQQGVYRGVSAYYSHNSYVAQVADVVMENNRPVIKKVYCAIDCGIVINPSGAGNQAEGGIVDGIGHAMYSAMSFKNGIPQQKNFDTYRLIRINEAPQVETFYVDNGESPTGLGEPTLPPVGAAIANAIFKATGTRFYKQPFIQESAVLG